MKQKYPLAAILIAIIGTFSIEAQNIDKDWLDGEIYVQVKKSFYDHLAIDDPEDISINAFPLLTEREYNAYGIEKIRQSFAASGSDELMRTFRIYFNDHGGIYSFISRLEEMEEVEYAEPVPLLKKTYTPNDLRSANPSAQTNQWSLHKIQAQGAWDVTTGNANVVVAIVDDAVEVDHQDLTDNAYINTAEIPNNGIDDDGNGYVDDYKGFDVATSGNNPSPPSQQYSHGTHVAGISGATTDNGTGMASIGFNINILGVKATRNSQFVTDGYEGIVYSVVAGADIVNMSWGGSSSHQTGFNVVNYAHNNGVLLVGGAGNDGVSQQFYPAAYNNVVAVSSSNPDDSKSSFSNYGSWIDITAPGVQILSLRPFGEYTYSSGTSMASPLVAGLLGLMKSVNPGMSNENLLGCLYNTADNINPQNPGYTGMLGAGRINAKNAVECVLALSQEPPAPTVASDIISICRGDSVRFEAGTEAGMIEAVYWEFDGGQPSTSDEMNPAVRYDKYGEYDVKITAYNQFGESTMIAEKQVIVSPDARETVYQEVFDANEIAETGWEVNDPGNQLNWRMRNITGGNGSRAAAVLNYYNNNHGQENSMLSPVIDLSRTTDVELSFEHAYRRQSSNYTDTFKLSVIAPGATDISKDSVIDVKFEDGTGSLATGTILSTAFSPSSPDDWCYAGTTGADCFTYDLSDYAGLDNVRLKFASVNQQGNNFYINNVKITGTCQIRLSVDEVKTPSQTFTLYPNPASGTAGIRGERDITDVVIFDASGRLIQTLHNPGNGRDVTLDISSMPAGYYLVRVTSNDYSEMKKLIVK